MKYATEDLQHLLAVSKKLETIQDVETVKAAYKQLSLSYRRIYRKSLELRDYAVWQIHEAQKVIHSQREEITALNQIVDDLMDKENFYV
ncbi:MAG: hypothetical protein ACRDBG_13295 [Waterburya sp.]